MPQLFRCEEIKPMENLVLLSTVAVAAAIPKGRQNPRCFKPGHSSWKKESIQRHTCSRCFKERMTELVANANLTRWDVACILAREFRNYYCCCCILSNGPDGVALTKYCNRGHRGICQQRRCIQHNVRLTDCRECPDPRAGTSFHFCGKRMSTKCSCTESALGNHPQDAAVVELKGKLAEDMLQRARDMDA
jgi:hypothetical protein